MFVADVKSTGLFMTDPVLQANGAKALYWKTGHSYMKRYTFEQKALVGFEKSGHFFFQPPLGAAMTMGLVAALAVCDMLDRAPDKSMADLRRELPKTYQSPTMSPHCDDEKKYGIVEKIVGEYEGLAKNGGTIAGQKIRDLVTVNGVRVTLEDGTWGLVRVVEQAGARYRGREPGVGRQQDRDLPRYRGASRQASRGRRVQSEDLRRQRTLRVPHLPISPKAGLRLGLSECCSSARRHPPVPGEESDGAVAATSFSLGRRCREAADEGLFLALRN